ncbi:HD domain-containing protein [Desulfomicrobium baculatum]|uniref:Metal dependent phosphohydrolase n=1 Tax=Desulfomicrobium baculatum (strain DSM 4028 / VKM B-1378 / X) TaxID=525897 RepID=C7LRM3_DESBD|nr:HD domain-containing protein [Desulfomicrobium baculatum]ACU90531.1 metal dependent phosphohydrolase [Desulfomicrobium baculatum DSM 4028]
MDQPVLRGMRARFVEMAGEYAQRLGDRREHIVLKRDHSLRVHALAAKIVARESIAPAAPYLAAALVHDIGRFSQFERFGTYRDDESVDHGEEGADFLRGGDFLAAFEPQVRECIIMAVRLHNKREIPADLEPLSRSLCIVVRDADKLDIVPVVLSKLSAPGPRDSVVTLGLMDEPQAWTEDIADVVAGGESPAYGDLRYINDFKLLLASWGPKLVHGASRRIFAGRGYLDRLFALLPQTDRFAELKVRLAIGLER